MIFFLKSFGVLILSLYLGHVIEHMSKNILNIILVVVLVLLPAAT